MEIWPDTSEPATWVITADLDITGSATAAAYLDGTWHTMDWTDDGIAGDGTWTRTADLLVRGAAAEIGALVTETDDVPPIKITVAGQAFVRESSKRFTVHPAT